MTNTLAAADKYASPANSVLPPSDMELDLARTALVVSDPQVDFLSPQGVTWGVVGQSVTELDTVANLDRLFAAAKRAGIVVAVSPHSQPILQRREILRLAWGSAPGGGTQ